MVFPAASMISEQGELFGPKSLGFPKEIPARPLESLHLLFIWTPLVTTEARECTAPEQGVSGDLGWWSTPGELMVIQHPASQQECICCVLWCPSEPFLPHLIDHLCLLSLAHPTGTNVILSASSTMFPLMPSPPNHLRETQQCCRL